MSADVILFLLLPLAVIVAGVVILSAGLRHRTRALELMHQERLALIERGMMPPPLAAGGYDGHDRPPNAGTRSRSFSLGIIVVGLGLALMTVISIAGDDTSTGVGVGGAVAVLGAAFIARALLAGAPPPAGAPAARAAWPAAAPPPPPSPPSSAPPPSFDP